MYRKAFRHRGWYFPPVKAELLPCCADGAPQFVEEVENHLDAALLRAAICAAERYEREPIAVGVQVESPWSNRGMRRVVRLRPRLRLLCMERVSVTRIGDGHDSLIQCAVHELVTGSRPRGKQAAIR